jgi:hypothetical protein
MKQEHVKFSINGITKLKQIVNKQVAMAYGGLNDPDIGFILVSLVRIMNIQNLERRNYDY